MIAALFLFTAVWFGLILDEEFGLSRGDRLVRLAAGIVLGAFCSAWLLFLMAWACGFTEEIILGGTGLMLGFNLYAWHYRGRNRAWLAALPGPNRAFWLASAVPTVVITVYFGVCVWANAEGDILFRGNTRDLAFHMGTVSAFVEQSVFPPYNPQSAGARLSYHFMANFFAAILNKGGFDLLYALKIPMVLLAFSLCTLTCHLFYTVAKSRAATLFAALLFFFGHVGVVNVLFGLLGYPSGNIPLSLGSWASIEDHITYPYYNFLNVIIDYFQPQLPFLAGFPLAMLILVALYRKHTERALADRTTYFLLGAVAFLPLFHMHTFLTLAPLVGLFVLSESAPRPADRSPTRSWFVRLVDQLAIEAPAHPGASPRPASAHRPANAIPWTKLGALGLAAIPIGVQLAFILSQQKTAGFSAFDVAKHLGALPEIPDWLHLKRVWFWLRVAGPSLVLGLAGLGWWLLRSRGATEQDRRGKTALIALLLITGFYFCVINVFRFTPNWGDSNKFVLYLNVLLCLCAGRWLAALWQKSRGLKITAVALVSLGSVVPSGIEWAQRYRREPERLFSASDRMVADWIKINTPKDAVFLTANSFVHLVPALAGRRVVNGSYTRETGFADQQTEDTVARAYREADPALITSARVTHVMIGPEENGIYRINRAAFARHHRLIFDQPSRNAAYTVYEARPPSLELVRAKADPVDGQSYVGISELEPRVVQQSYGTLKYDRAFNLDPLTLKGHRYANGLGTHANSDLQFNLGGNYDRFEADVGVDDSQIGGAGSVQFEVWVDERNVYRSLTQRAGDTPAKISVDITGGSILRLVVTDAGDGDHSDHADWAEARLRRRPALVGEPTPDERANVPPELHTAIAQNSEAPPPPFATTNRLWLIIPLLVMLAWFTRARWRQWGHTHRSPLEPRVALKLATLARSGVNSGLDLLNTARSRLRKTRWRQAMVPATAAAQPTHEKARAEPKNRKRIQLFYPWLLTGVFMALAGFGAVHHEMWRDEMQAWLIARDLSGFKALIDQAKHEATPPLWSPLLASLAYFTRQPEAMQVLTWVLAVATFLVFCLRAPLTAAQKGLLSCNYFLVYQYGTVCRNYLLGILGLALACAVMLSPKPKPLLGVLCLLVAVFASVHSFILAIALATAFWIPSIWLRWIPSTSGVGGRLDTHQVTVRDATRYLTLFGAGAALAAYLVAPSADVNYGPAMHWNLSWSPVHLAKLCWAFITSQFTWPRPSGFFWIPGWDTPFRSFDDRVAIAGAALLLLGSLLFFIRSPRALLAYAMGTLGIALFLYTKYLGFIRHTGFLFISFLCAYWIFFALADPSSINSKSWRFRIPRVVLTAMLICQAITGLWALREDYNHPFSCGKATADYLVKNGLSEGFIAVGPDWAGAPIAGYLDRTLYYPYTGHMGSFTNWNHQRREFMPDPELYANARTAAPAGPFILILDHPITESFCAANGIELLTQIGGSLTPFEDYYIHRCR